MLHALRWHLLGDRSIWRRTQIVSSRLVFFWSCKLYFKESGPAEGDYLIAFCSLQGDDEDDDEEEVAIRSSPSRSAQLNRLVARRTRIAPIWCSKKTKKNPKFTTFAYSSYPLRAMRASSASREETHSFLRFYPWASSVSKQRGQNLLLLLAFECNTD